MAVIGLDLGGTKLAGALFDATGNLLARRVEPLAKRQGHEVGALLIDMFRELRAFAQTKKLEVTGVGAAVPGIASAHTGKVWAPNIPGWEDYPLRDELKAAAGSKSCRVVVDSDRACSILGEQWKGAAQGCSHAVFLAVGTGIGAGILIDGQVLRGAQDIAGATGWMALDQEFRDEYVSCGCFEYHASGEGIAKVARAMIAAETNHTGSLASISPEKLTAHEVFAAYGQNDPIARRTIESAIRAWGAAAANFVSLFNPERIIFGGGVFGPALRFLEDIRREAEKWAQPISMRSVQIVGSKLGSDAALFGAGFLALQKGKALR
ncbi:MAG: ROK family protein [Bacteroidota bacterium]